MEAEMPRLLRMTCKPWPVLGRPSTSGCFFIVPRTEKPWHSPARPHTVVRIPCPKPTRSATCLPPPPPPPPRQAALGPQRHPGGAPGEDPRLGRRVGNTRARRRAVSLPTDRAARLDAADCPHRAAPPSPPLILYRHSGRPGSHLPSPPPPWLRHPGHFVGLRGGVPRRPAAAAAPRPRRCGPASRRRRSPCGTGGFPGRAQ